jgi:protein-S-isoprenylcysteine O-methyltransferase Ste14
MAYIYIAVKYFYIAVKYFEEKDLVAAIGAPYVTYQEDVGMFFPGIGKNPSTPKSSAAAE